MLDVRSDDFAVRGRDVKLDLAFRLRRGVASVGRGDVHSISVNRNPAVGFLQNTVLWLSLNIV